MKKLLILVVLFAVGCTIGPNRQDYQTLASEKMESPFFYIPPLNQKDFKDRTWILLAESKTKLWFYDPYTLIEDEDGVLSFAAYIALREKNNLPAFNATIVGPYLQKLDCFSNNQWSETLYTKDLLAQRPLVGDAKPVNGSGWVKIKPNTAMAYVRSRLCGRKFIDDQNVNYFLFQDGTLPAPIAKKAPVEVFEEKQGKQIVTLAQEEVTEPSNAKPPIFFEVINNEVTILDSKKEIRQLRINAYYLDKNLSKQADYIFTANCSDNSYAMTAAGAAQKLSATNGAIGAKDSLSAVAFNRACGNHGAYMKTTTRSAN
ncbi:hypothetical protein [Polynucleobacter sp. KF022]|uniref:hypothetical protein n=1 Tax=Polynucleobacter sp. KF022 TaxID=2982615 RepID=UPI0023779D25|nr:hypothetical protein [Polynucleobacter sp. KF022]BDT74642.1 hypothetical protein PKF022_03070 [Polynucleobacter sp. KF022]